MKKIKVIEYTKKKNKKTENKGKRKQMEKRNKI